jgi:hypothetical protein
MNIDIFEKALNPVLQPEVERKGARILFTEYRAELENRNLSVDELMDVAAYSMVNAELDADKDKLKNDILNTIIDDYESREASLATLPWDEITADLENRIEQMNSTARQQIMHALAIGIQVQKKLLDKTINKLG